MEPEGIIVPDNISYSEPNGKLSTSSCPLSVRFWTIILYELFLFLMNATYPVHEIFLDQMSLTAFGEEYKLCSFSQVCSCSHIFLLGPNSLVTTMC